MAFHYTTAGYRGSQLIWKMVVTFKAMPEGIRVDLPNGFSLNTRKSDWNKSSIYKGQYERPLLRFLTHVKPSGLVIDIGANIGITLWSTAAFRAKESYFLGFEPSPSCFEQLSELVSDREIPCELFPIALGAKETILEIYGTANQLNSGWATFAEHGYKESDRIPVSVTTLDKVLENEKFANKDITLIKIDTEGFEGEVLAGSKQTLGQNPPDILILEVSPMFGDISYLRDLWKKLSSEYDFFSLCEAGVLKRSTHLRAITLSSILATAEQINLVSIKRNLVPEFQKFKDLVFS